MQETSTESKVIMPDGLIESFNNFDFKKSIIASGLVGSKAHNTFVEGGKDDIDLMGIFIPPIEYNFGLNSIDNWVSKGVFDNKDYDWSFHSLKKYSQLLLGGNPNILCFLYLRDQDYIYRDEVFNSLNQNKHLFASIAAYKAFKGYAHAQLQRIDHFDLSIMGDKRRELIEKYGYSTKEAGHAIRLLLMGLQYISTGTLTVWQSDKVSETLKSIKRGEWSLERVKKYATDLYDKLRDLEDNTPLPKKPDHDAANKLVTQLHIEYYRKNGYI